MIVENIMMKNFASVSPEETLKVVWAFIFKKHINAVIVIDKKKKLLGICTREDILETLYPDYSEYIDQMMASEDRVKESKEIKEALNIKVKTIMKKEVIFTRGDTPIMRALARMIARRVDQLPVLDDDDTAIGIITKKDIFNNLYRQHRSMFFLKKKSKR